MVSVKILISLLFCIHSSLSEDYMPECSLTLAPLPHGTMVQRPSTSGQIIHYSCNHGYRLAGSDTQTCINGTWSPPLPPVCRRYQEAMMRSCATDQQITHGHIRVHPENSGFRHVPKDTTASVICDAGYLSDDTFQVRFVIVCGPYGIWTTSEGSDDLNRCTRKQCPTPPEVPRARFRYNSGSPSMGEGTEVEYICSPGYMLLDPDDATLTCINGQWEGPVPTCVLKTSCDAPTFIRNGKWSVLASEKSQMSSYENSDTSVGYSKFDVGTKIFYSCSPGYKLEGPRILQCTTAQIWSRAPPSCIPKTEHIRYCPHFGPIKNGFCKCMGQDTADLQLCMPFHGGTRIECTCMLGYTLQGMSVLTCTHSSGLNVGQWDWDTPTCVKRYAPASEGENDIGMLPDGKDGGGTGKGYNSGDIRDSKTKVSSLVIVVTTACSVLGILVLIMVVVIVRRKKPRTAIFQQGSTPPPYARVHNTAMDEHDRLALMAYADASRIHLPSYEEAMQPGRPGSHIGVGGRGALFMDRSVSPTTSEYQRLPNVLVRSNMHHPGLAGDGNNNINNNNNNNSNRHSTITTSTMNRDGLSEIFGSVDTVNVSMSDASTAVTVETFDSGTSNRSMVSQRATAGSLNSSEDHLANDDAPLLETSPQREVDVVSLSSNPSRTSKEE